MKEKWFKITGNLCLKNPLPSFCYSSFLKPTPISSSLSLLPFKCLSISLSLTLPIYLSSTLSILTTIPLQRNQPPPKNMVLAESGFSSPRNDAFPAGLRVLVVDDDPTWLKILEKMLKKCSYEGLLIFCTWKPTLLCYCYSYMGH